MSGEHRRRPIPLYLCCAEDNEVALIQVIDELHREGHTPEVVSGLDLDPSVLGLAVDRAKGEGLFVFCLSDELDRAAVRRLDGLFSARRGPGQRCITVPLNPKQPLSMLPRIREAIRGPVSPSSGDRRPKTDDAFRREVVAPVDFAPPWDSHAVREGLARRMHRELSAAEALLEQREQRAERSRESPLRGGTRVQGRVPVPRGPIRPSRDAFVQEPTHPPVPAPVVAPAAWSSSELAVTAEPSDPAISSGLFPRIPPERIPRPTRSFPAVSTTSRRSGSRAVWVGAVAALGGLGLMAVLYVSQGHELRASPVQAGVVALRSEPAVAPQGTSASVASRVAPPSSETPPAAGAPLEPEGSAPPLRRPPHHGGGTPPPPNPAPRVDPRARAIERAVDAGHVRQIGDAVLLPASSETLDWASAARYCREHAPAGLPGFELPSSAQLRRLLTALPAGAYWVRDAAPSDDEARALDRSSAKVHVYLRVETAAKAACVLRYQSSTSSASR